MKSAKSPRSEEEMKKMKLRKLEVMATYDESRGEFTPSVNDIAKYLKKTVGDFYIQTWYGGNSFNSTSDRNIKSGALTFEYLV